MGTAERKERERAEREERILYVGRRMLVEHGYHGLCMDRIAQEIEYSKGIVYQHFSSKEDLLCAISIDLLKSALDFLRRGARFRGNARERLAAESVAMQLHCALNPDGFQAQLLIWVNSIAEKAPEARRAKLGLLESEVMEILTEIVEDAVRRKELVPPPDFKPVDLVHGMWTMLVGTELVAQAGKTIEIMKHMDYRSVTRRNFQIFLDGFGWKPLSTEWDYKATVKRILDDIFSDEHEKLLKSGGKL